MAETILAFVADRLNEEEKRLWHMRKQVIERIWCASPMGAAGWRIGIANGQDDGWAVAQRMEESVAEYIVTVARPNQVLANLASKRRILARHSAAPGGEELAMPLYCNAHAYRHRDGTVSLPVQLNNCPDLRDLAAPYNWHPEYRPEWAPT